MQNKIKEKMNRVENGPFGKLVRTLGYLALLVATLLLAVSSLRALDIQFLNSFLDLAIDFKDNSLLFLNDYTLFIYVIGVLLLIWPLSKGWFLPTLSTITILLGVFVAQTEVVKIIPFLNLNSIDFVNNLLTDLNWLLLVVFAVPMFFMYMLFGLKKPKRIATSLVSSAMLVLIVGIALNNLPLILNNNWHTNNIYNIVVLSLMSLTFVLQALGSLLGVIGFARK